MLRKLVMVLGSSTLPRRLPTVERASPLKAALTSLRVKTSQTLIVPRVSPLTQPRPAKVPDVKAVVRPVAAEDVAIMAADEAVIAIAGVGAADASLLAKSMKGTEEALSLLCVFLAVRLT